VSVTRYVIVFPTVPVLRSFICKLEDSHFAGCVTCQSSWCILSWIAVMYI